MQTDVSLEVNCAYTNPNAKDKDKCFGRNPEYITNTR